jgi:tRNA dimethylallyltransferase
MQKTFSEKPRCNCRMNLLANTNVAVLTGPTGSGKTDLALMLAERHDAEIIAMDSMTLYRGMDIGTAKPGAAQRRRVPHHLLDVLDPWESGTATFWLTRARSCAEEILRRGKRVLFVGGTPLYLKALLYGIFDGPPASEPIRQRLEADFQSLGSRTMHDRLAGVDPTAAARLHPNDQRRIIRALEVWELTGRPISEWQTQWSVVSGQWSVEKVEQAANDGTKGRSLLSTVHWQLSTVLWLDRPRDELYARINDRVPKMIAAGLIDEVRVLRNMERPLSKEASQALGYKEMFDLLDGQAGLEETVARIQTRTRNFAKRQITWFRHLPECRRVSEELTSPLWGS